MDKDFKLPDNYYTKRLEKSIRYRLPEAPFGWNTIEKPENNMLNTMRGYHYFLCHEASSAMQKAVRRCNDEALQWSINNFWTGKSWRTNVMKRCLIICSEDIGPANLSLILLVEDILEIIIKNDI